jgi:hypothetical protein
VSVLLKKYMEKWEKAQAVSAAAPEEAAPAS